MDGSDGVESLEQVWARVSAFWYEKVMPFSGQNIVTVSHGDTLQILSGFLLGQTIETSLESWYPQIGEMKALEWGVIDV